MFADACSAFFWSSTLVFFAALLRGQIFRAAPLELAEVSVSVQCAAESECMSSFAVLLANAGGVGQYVAITVVAVAVEEAVRWWLYIMYR